MGLSTIFPDTAHSSIINCSDPLDPLFYNWFTVLITLICPSWLKLPSSRSVQFGLNSRVTQYPRFSIWSFLNLDLSQLNRFSIGSFLNRIFSQSDLFSIGSFLNQIFSQSDLFSIGSFLNWRDSQSDLFSIGSFWGRHPMLYFNIPRTEKCSIAMC